MHQEKRLINIHNDELKLHDSPFKAFLKFHRHSFRHIPPQSHQFPVPNGKTGVGGLMFDDRHVGDV